MEGCVGYSMHVELGIICIAVEIEPINYLSHRKHVDNSFMPPGRLNALNDET